MCGHKENPYFPSRQDAADESQKQLPVLFEK